MTPVPPPSVEKKGWTAPKVWRMHSGSAEGLFTYRGYDGYYGS